MQVWRHKADDLAAVGWLGQQVLIAVEDVAQLHAIAIGLAPWANDVTFHVNDSLTVGQDCRNVDVIAIVDSESCNGSPR
jgi:hypothetical protein